MHESEHATVDKPRMFYLLAIDLLIVGPSKSDTKQLRQTDGERFFGDRMHVKFAKESGGRIGPLATVKTQKRS